MGNAAYWVPEGIILDLNMADLGHPDRPGLWDELYGREHWVPDLLCPKSMTEPDHDCPKWLYLSINRWGQRVTGHKNGDTLAHPEPESDRHKCLKDRIATVAERAGFEVSVEDHAGRGRGRITDVLVKSETGFKLGCEAQMSYLSEDQAKRRTGIARSHGITPLWTVDIDTAPLINHVPWAQIRRTSLNDLGDPKYPLRVMSGIRALNVLRCRDLVTVCPEKRAGRNCAGWHASWEPRAHDFDALVVRAAGQSYVPIEVPVSRGSHWYWVPTEDAERYTAVRKTQDEARPAPRQYRPLDGKEFTLECNYGVDSGIRSAPAERPNLNAPTLSGSFDALATTTRPTAATKPLVLRLSVPDSEVPPASPVGARCSRTGCGQPNPSRYGPAGGPWCPACRAGVAATQIGDRA